MTWTEVIASSSVDATVIQVEFSGAVLYPDVGDRLARSGLISLEIGRFD